MLNERCRGACCSPPIAPDPPSGVDSHVPEARSDAGTLTTRLRQCSTGRHSSLPGTPFAVGAQRGGTTRLPSATARPHL